MSFPDIQMPREVQLVGLTFTRLVEPVKIEGGTVEYLFANHHNSPAPVAMLRLDVGEGAGWIGPLFVAEAYRNRKVGSELLRRAFDVCREYGFKTCGLSVADNNPNARRLYEREGFLPFIEGQPGYKQMIKVL